MGHVNKERIYSRAEYISDAIVHVSGIGAALIGGPILVALAAIWVGDPGLITALVIYAVTLLAMLTCSALYNMITLPAWTDRLRRMDQSAIYMKIAGTYTPFIALSAGHLGLLTAIWGGAIAGASLILFSMRKHTGLAIVLYLGLGWACVVWGWPMLAALTGPGFWLLVTGGVLYSVGVPFLIWSRLPFHNTIWHVFVLAATAICYAALVVEVAQAASV
ncbi:MAG: hemolysin III family protein [Pseudomonadota bacterium]